MATEEANIRARLEYLRGEIRAEQIAMSEVAELQGLAGYIEPGDVELLEWAGVSESEARARAAYVACALWASTDDQGDPLDARYSAADIAPAALAEMAADVAGFIEEADRRGIDRSDWSDDELGHDLWLTRNGHGAGFWDRGRGFAGEALAALARSFEESDLYVGDDGLLYVYPEEGGRP